MTLSAMEHLHDGSRLKPLPGFDRPSWDNPKYFNAANGDFWLVLGEMRMEFSTRVREWMALNDLQPNRDYVICRSCEGNREVSYYWFDITFRDPSISISYKLLFDDRTFTS